jgi:predicted house-cleaning noncanonical NTP pyrophosphatase (MazG superfamily)
MSSDERFIKIENALGVLAEHQARHAEEISELRAMQKVMTLAIAKSAEIQQASARKIDEGMKELHEAQRITEEKLHALIDSVDRIIRDRGSRS